MSFSPSPSPDPGTPTHTPLVAVQVPQGALDQLSAEREACDSAERRAILLYEEGWIRALLNDVDASITTLVESAERVQHFVEPLFSALGVAERQAPERISEILSHLENSFVSGEERTQALLYLALAALVRSDTAKAREYLDAASANDATEPSTWLLFELLAVHTHDEDLRERALAMQAEATQHRDWKSLLHCEAARIADRLGETERALEAFKAAADLGGEAAWAPLQELERWGILHAQPEVTKEALQRQASLFSVLGENAASRLGLLPEEGSLHAVYSALKAALWGRASGDGVQARFDDALELAKGHAGVRALALADAGIGSDLEACTRHATAWLELEPTDSEKAAAWLHIAVSARQRGDLARALAAAGSARVATPEGLLAPALELELHAQADQPKALAELYERLAQQSTTVAERDRYIYRAAEMSARHLGQAPRARELLQHGEPNTAVERLRIERFLAASIADKQWFEDAGTQLGLILTAGEPGLHFETVRRAALRGAAVPLNESQPEAEALLSAWLGAYGPSSHLSTPEEVDKALLWIANSESDPELRHSRMSALALRMCLTGKPDRAARALTEAEESGYREPVAALMMANLSQKRGAWKETAQALSQLALGTHDREHAAALLLQAGLCSWRANEPQTALASFESAHELAPAASRPLLAWGRRVHQPDLPDVRRKALEAPLSDESRALLLLQRFTLEAQEPDGLAKAGETLALLVAETPSELCSTSALTEALWFNATEASCDERCEVFERLADWGEQATVIARSATYYARLADERSGQADIRDCAEEWVKCDPTVLPALEWLWASQQSEDPESEARAHHTLAARLHGSARCTFERTAATMQLLLDENAPKPELTGTDAESRLLNLELSPPGSDPRRRATSLAHAMDVLGDENRSLLTALAGYNLLAAGELASAEQAFQVAAAESPEDIFVWEGLRAVAEASNNRGLLAEAYAGLGDSVTDDAQGALYWEKAAGILLDELSEPVLGEHALSRSVARDIHRTRCFDRLFRIVREKKDHPRLLELIDARESATDDPEELAKLFWERARAMRSLNRLPEALLALESVQMLEPDHVGALALAAEIYMSRGDFAQAAEQLANLANQRNAPAQQRLMSGVAAVDIYENRLKDTAKALSVLADLYRSGHSTLPVRERLARAAAGAGAFEQALDVLEDLSRERETSQGRAEAARLCLVIARDKLQQPARAKKAALCLLAELPADPEALDLVMATSEHDAEIMQQLANRSRTPLVRLVLSDPFEPGPLKLLDRLATCLGDAPLRQVTLGALVLLGHGDPAIEAELRKLDEKVPSSPSMAIDAHSIPDLLDPEDEGPLAQLFHEAAPSYAEILGPTLESFGVGKKQRVEPRLGLAIRNEISAWAGALGVGEFELYVGGEQPDRVRGIIGEPPALVIGTSVLSPLSPAHRQAVARELFALRRGTSILRSREPTEVAALIAATGQVLGVDQKAPSYALTAEFVRLLGKGLSRKAKKALPPLLEQTSQAAQEPLRWVAAALSSMDRVAALAAGDVSWVLAKTPDMRGSRVSSVDERERLRKLLCFVLDPRYLALRKELGLGVQ